MANLSANISYAKLDRNNRETALESTRSPLHRLKIS